MKDVLLLDTALTKGEFHPSHAAFQQGISTKYPVSSRFRRQLISLTFLCDADGATAHPDPQGINPRVNEVLGLSRSHHCGEQKPV